jgi:ribokinase
LSESIFISVGSINADFQFEVSQDLSKGGTLSAEGFVQRAGGKGANRAYFARRLDLQATLIGCVGDDHFAEQALAPLRQAGTDLKAVTVRPGAATGVSMIAVPVSGAKTILLAANANQDWDRAALGALSSAIEQAPDKSVLALDFEISRAAVEIALEAAASRAFRVIADGSFGENVRPDDLARLYAIAPNVDEAAAIAQMHIHSDADAERAARKISDGGTTIVSIKLSDGGCLLVHDGQVQRIAAPVAEVVDKTGAGDAFTAALAVALMENRSASEAATWGVAASTLAVAAKGSQEAYPLRLDLEHMVEKVRALCAGMR